MKKHFLCIVVFLGLISQVFVLKGQNGCATPGCQFNGSYNISTGYNHATSSYQTPLSLEQNWKLTAIPTNATSITLPAPTYVISPGGWGTFSNAQWLSPFQTSGYSVNNWPPQAYGAFSFENCFCLCQGTTVNIQFDLMCDDAAYVYLDNVLIASATSGNQFVYANRLIYNQNVTLSAGQHCLRVDLFNSFGGSFGFALQGSILGMNILREPCCIQTGRICGTKLQDANCDSIIDPLSDQGLSGWTMILKDGNGNTVATAITDGQGNYCFANLAPGNYTVSEVNQGGWVQSYPGASSSYVHSISLAAGQVVTANFGNCNTVVNAPCQYNFNFRPEINNCGVKFNTSLPPLPTGYQIVGINWDFGDGSTSTELNPVHFYSSTGMYMVCAYITLFNGMQCCTVQFCMPINIDKLCDGGCDIDADIQQDSFNSKKCMGYFTGIINSSGVPISSLFWNFGDGTTGTGTSVSHHFPGSGTYHVCLYLFGDYKTADDDEPSCCFKEVCSDIVITCDPCDPSGGGGDGTKSITPPIQNNPSNATGKVAPQKDDGAKSAVVLNQNAPNPFAESTVITYSIPTSFAKAQIIFTNSQGKVINTFNITHKGEGKLMVYADDLSSGIYSYTLVVDGRAIDSKTMIKH